MGVARIFFGGEHFFKKIFKKFSKNIQKIFKKYSKNSKNFKKYWKILKNIQKKFIKFSKKFAKNFGKFWKIFLRNFLKMHYFQERPRDFIGGEVRSTRGGLVRGVAAWGVPGGGAPGRRRNFQKICKKSMKNLGSF